MTNILDGLIAKITDEAMRDSIAAEVALLRETRDFGLVFERHLPETVRLYSHPIKRGVRVQSRGDASRSWYVRRVAAGVATVVGTDGEQAEMPVTDLVVTAEFGQPIYPGLQTVAEVQRGEDKPSHLVIKSDNFHALQTLRYAFEGQVDCIYIDPPYNTGARDWKYNNDYVDSRDAFRHSKWLSFMEKRLALAKDLLNPDDSVLLITIDDNEVYSLGLLLDQVFKGCERQMVSITVSPRGKSRDRRLSQVDEYMVIVYVGAGGVGELEGSGGDKEVRWRYLRRNDIQSARGTKKGGPRQFYPIYVDEATGKIAKIGDPLTPDQPLEAAPDVPGAVAVFPIREDGVHMNWGLTGPSLKRALDAGYVRVTPGTFAAQPYTFAYLTAPNIKKVATGALQLAGTRPDGSKIVVIPGGKAERPTTAWREKSYDAGSYGTTLLRAFVPDRTFPYPKSLYAVEDSLRLFVGSKPDALILDFFAGSGTTAHAVMRLNHQDGGRRRSISVTNNEVSDDEAKALLADGHLPGDAAWEELGIFSHITMPRIVAAVTGRTYKGDRVEGDYAFVDEFPMAAGFEENLALYELTYLDSNQVSRGAAFEAIAPLLWMKAGARGAVIRTVEEPFALPKDANYGILFDVADWRDFADELDDRPDVSHVFVVTDSLAQYQQVVASLPPTVEARMLYDDYLHNFEINAGALS